MKFFLFFVGFFHLSSCDLWTKEESKKNCEDLDNKSCEQNKHKTCRVINSKCKEIIACDDLNPLGSSGCKNFGNEKCQWDGSKCAQKSGGPDIDLLADFMSVNRTFDKFASG